MTGPVNPRPGVPVAIADKTGRLLLYAPGAWWGEQRRRAAQTAKREEDRHAEGKAADGGTQTGAARG